MDPPLLPDTFKVTRNWVTVPPSQPVGGGLVPNKQKSRPKNSTSAVGSPPAAEKVQVHSARSFAPSIDDARTRTVEIPMHWSTESDPKSQRSSCRFMSAVQDQ